MRFRSKLVLVFPWIALASCAGEGSSSETGEEAAKTSGGRGLDGEAGDMGTGAAGGGSNNVDPNGGSNTGGTGGAPSSGGSPGSGGSAPLAPTCADGYRAENDKTCVDIDECAEGASGCPDSCENLPGTFTCSGFYAREVTWDLIESRLSVCVDYVGDHAEFLDDRYWVTVKIAGTSLDLTGMGNLSSNRLNDDSCHHSWFNATLTNTLLDEIHAEYPDGQVPVHVITEIAEKGASSPEQQVTDSTHTVSIEKLLPGHIFDIGVVQVVPPGFRIEDQEVCLFKNIKWGGTGYEPRGIDEDCVERYDRGSNADDIVVKTVPLAELLYAAEETTPITEISSVANRTQDVSVTIDVASWHGAGQYWRHALESYGLTSRETRLGLDPQFRLTLLDPIAQENTLVDSNHGTVKGYFDEVVASEGLDLSLFDFLIFVMYFPEPGGATFNRSFALNRNGYISFPLYGNKVVRNSSFLTVIHELGHQLFRGNDLYDGFALKYPEGLPSPDLSQLPQQTACIMTKLFGWEQITATRVENYETTHYKPEHQAAGISANQTSQLENYGLCADTIVEILGGEENPNCSLSEFYAQQCGDCDASNYLTCTR